MLGSEWLETKLLVTQFAGNDESFGNKHPRSIGTYAQGREMHMWTWAIVIVVVLLGVGLVSSQLLRLRDWLKNAPPPPVEPPDEVTDR